MREEADHSKCAPNQVELPPDWIRAYRKYRRFWLNLARSSSLSEEDAQDILHAVIASALGPDRRSFQSLEHIRNYVARGVVNRSIQLVQRGGRCTEFTERTEIMLAEQSDEPDYDGCLLRNLLLEGLVGLPRKDFDILKHRYYSGLTFQEISTLTDVPVSTLKSREEAAMKKLRSWFRKRGILGE
jgi:RNA polymerase sigma factor (sigma-70 family)